jgi:hypothetical protein
MVASTLLNERVLRGLLGSSTSLSLGEGGGGNFLGGLGRLVIEKDQLMFHTLQLF